MNKVGWKKLPEEVRYAAILEAASSCFMEKGYHGASMQDVAKTAGLTKGGLYHHFDSKEAIRDALLERFLDLDRLGVNDVVSTDISHEDKLLKVGRCLLAGLATEGGSAARFMADAVACSGTVVAIENFRSELAQTLDILFEEAAQANLLKDHAPSCQKTRLYMAVVDGLQIGGDIDGLGKQTLQSQQATLALFVKAQFA